MLSRGQQLDKDIMSQFAAAQPQPETPTPDIDCIDDPVPVEVEDAAS